MTVFIIIHFLFWKSYCLTDFTDFRNRIQRANVPVNALHKRAGNDPRIYARLWALYRTCKPHIVHTRNLSGLEYLIPAALAGIPGRIHGEHGLDFHELHGSNFKYNLLRKVTTPVVSRYIAVSNDLERWMVRDLGISHNRVYRIYNGVDHRRFHPRTTQIVTVDASPIRTLKDLGGEEVGFPSLAAFVGYAVPMDALLRQGITVIPVFGGNQEGFMGQLKAGKVIAAGVNNQVMKAFAARENIRYRVLWESPPFHNLPFAAHPRVPKAVVDAVRSAIDAMDSDPEGAKVLEEVARAIGQKPPHGFRAATQEYYRSYTDFYRNTLVKDIK